MTNYLSKKVVLSLYVALSKMDSDHKQGATQLLSSIRYFVALDRFFKQHKSPCDTKDKNQKENYCQYVGEVVDICDGFYAAKFYYPLKKHDGDFCVGSNFFSAGVVYQSTENPGGDYTYPKGRKKPLFLVKNGVISKEDEYYPNINELLGDNVTNRVALCLWLLRYDTLDLTISYYDAVKDKLNSKYTNVLVDTLLPTKDQFDSVVAESSFDGFDSAKAILSEGDIKGLFFENEVENYDVDDSDVYDDNDDDNGCDSNNNVMEIIKLLVSNHNLILTGAPGTGKTYLAQEIAKTMGAEWKIVQFHPSYDYTDFVEGLRPIKKGNDLGFERKDGVFKKFCKEAIEGSVKTTDADIDEAIERFASDVKKKGSIPIEYVSSSKGSFDVSMSTDNSFKITIQTDNPQSATFQSIKEVIKTGEKVNHQTYSYCIGLHIKNEYLQKSPTPRVFIIDEINRGEISKIFGELFYSIDPGYRGEKGKIDTQYQNLIPKEGDADFDPKNADVFRNGFYIPENVYIIGTMNDIDRGVESMDFAIRRRFAWKEITAESRQAMLDDEKAWKNNKPDQDIVDEIKNRMNNLNACIIDNYGNEELSSKDRIGLSKAYQIGASYFLKYGLYNNFEELWNNHLVGLLYEYLRGTTNIEVKIERLHNAYNDITAH